MLERKNEASLRLKDIAVELGEMKSFDSLDAYQLSLKLQTTLSFYSSRTDSSEFCMTLGLIGVSKMKVTSEWCQCSHPSHKTQ